MAPFGKVHDVTRKFEFEWRIEDFFTLPVKNDKRCDSSLFSFAGESWFFGIYPNGQSSNNAVGYIALYLYRNKSGPPITLTVSLGLKAVDGKKDEERQFTYEYVQSEGRGHAKLLKRTTLLEKNVELVPSDTLTVICTIEHNSKPTDENDASNNLKAECSHCKEYFNANDASFHEEKCLNKPIKCPTCADVVELRKWFDHECKRTKLKATEKLADDLGNIFRSQEHTDVTIKVKDEEFRLHRNILVGRNSYFNSMFKTEMKEKTTGIVSIDDCEPDVFRSFILFVYTGKVDDMSLENVCDLYELADKYQEDQLKEECLYFMKANLSIESFCDFIVVALKHEENDLLQNATELFCRNTKEIIESAKWQIFLKEYSTQANDLYLKSFAYNIK